MKSMRCSPSYRRASKSTVGGSLLTQQCVVRHSILKMRFGKLPLTEVKIPCPAPVPAVHRSVHPGAITKLPEVGAHPDVLAVELRNWRLPFELIFTEVNV